MSIELKANASAAGKPLKHFWSGCTGAGRANEGLRADWQEHLRLAVKECGFKYIRFHGLYHDDMFVYREENGQPVFNFQYVDTLFDALLDIGVKPFVEFGFCPGDLATEKGTVFWWKGHGSPPKDYAKWASFDSRDKAYETLALGKPEQLNIELTGLKPGEKILVETLDKQNGNAMGAWEAMGKPKNPTREQTKQLREKAAATKREGFTADANGSFKLERTIEPWSVVLIVGTDNGKRMGANE